jgi:hypothetical protein
MALSDDGICFWALLADIKRARVTFGAQRWPMSPLGHSDTAGAAATVREHQGFASIVQARLPMN